MLQSIINNSNAIFFFDADANVISENIWDKITLEDLSKSSFDNHYINSARYIQSPDSYKPVFKNIYPVPPRSKWLYDGISFECTQSLEVNKLNYNIFDLIQKFIQPLKKYKIGVELSGGLDSSAVFCMLHHIMGKTGTLKRTPKDWQSAFVATFPDTGIDEREYASDVVQFFKGNAHYITPDYHNLVQNLVAKTSRFLLTLTLKLVPLTLIFNV